MLPDPWRLRTVGALIVVEGAVDTVVVVAGKLADRVAGSVVGTVAPTAVGSLSGGAEWVPEAPPSEDLLDNTRPTPIANSQTATRIRVFRRPLRVIRPAFWSRSGEPDDSRDVDMHGPPLCSTGRKASEAEERRRASRSTRPRSAAKLWR